MSLRREGRSIDGGLHMIVCGRGVVDDAGSAYCLHDAFTSADFKFCGEKLPYWA